MVQSFLVEESKELIYDADKLSEWKQKCEALGLSDQLALAATDKSPIPFEAMNEVSLRVYSTLCPEMRDYKKYNRTTIPLEVLALIHLSVNEGYFKSVEIWYDDKAPDPLAVGFTQAKGEYSHRDNFLIARWGDMLRPFEELKSLALTRYTHASRLSLQSKISDLQHRLENVEVNSARYFEGDAQYYDVTGF